MTTTTAKQPLLLRQLTPVQLQVLDVVHAALVGLLCWFAAAEQPVPPATGWHEPGWVAIVAAVLLAAPTVIRRRWPLPATVAVVVAAVAALATGVVPDYASAGPLIAVAMVLYIVGMTVGGARSIGVVVAVIAALIVASVVQGHSPFGPGAVGAAFIALVISSSWALGWTVRERRAQAARTIEQATARAVDEERLRIAREVHDIVAHSMSLIAVKATIANHVADERPDEVRDALRIIEDTSRNALVEMRRTLGALRAAAASEPDPGGGQDLAVLIRAAESTGLKVDFVHNDADQVPAELDMAVFRIVQEALTNVVKHASATRCRVAVQAQDGAVCVEITDNGRGQNGIRMSGGGAAAGTATGDQAAAPDVGGADAAGENASADRGAEVGTAGHGLVGMRERVELYGGELYAGPGSDGGWVVRARLDAVS